MAVASKLVGTWRAVAPHDPLAADSPRRPRGGYPSRSLAPVPAADGTRAAGRALAVQGSSDTCRDESLLQQAAVPGPPQVDSEDRRPRGATVGAQRVGRFGRQVLDADDDRARGKRMRMRRLDGPQGLHRAGVLVVEQQHHTAEVRGRHLAQKRDRPPVQKGGSVQHVGRIRMELRHPEPTKATRPGLSVRASGGRRHIAPCRDFHARSVFGRGRGIMMVD